MMYMEIGRTSLLGTGLKLFDKHLFDWANKIYLQIKKRVVVVLVGVLEMKSEESFIKRVPRWSMMRLTHTCHSNVYI